MEFFIEFINNQINSPTYPYQQKINEFKKRLRDTDYKAIKYAEGLIPLSEYQEIRAERQEWRDEINQLEKQIESLYAPTKLS